MKQYKTNYFILKRIISFSLIFLILLSSLIFSSCENESDEKKSFPTTPPTGTDTSITSSDIEYNNIISAAPAITSALFELGCGSKIYAADQHSYGIESLPSDVQLYNMFNTSLEQISQASTDHSPELFITIEGFASQSLIEEFKSAESCEVIVFPKLSSIDDLRSFVLYLGSITGSSEKAEQIVTELDDLITAVKEAASASAPKTVYIELSDETPHPAAGGDSILTELIELCGSTNVFKSKSSAANAFFAEISTEEIVEKNPDMIFTANRYLDDPCDEILSRSELITVNALINNEVYKLPSTAALYPSADIASVIKTLAFYLCSYTAE